MTQKEIAKTLNITQAAVSMALKGSERISPALRESVCKLAANAGYRPNLAGQMLRRKRTNVIGAVFPRLTNLFFAELFQEIQRQLQPHGYMLYLAPAEMPDELGKVVENLKQMCVAGVIAFAAEDTQELLSLKESGIALVLYGGDRKLDEDVSQILPDRYEAALELVRLLIARGRRKIMFLGGSRKELRFQGYAKGLSEAGMKPIHVPLGKQEQSRFNHTEAGFETMKAFLSRGSDIDAVFAHNDETALGAKRAIMAAGFTIPDDIALTGFDNTSSGASLTPSLTTIEQPRGKIADALITELFATLDNPAHSRFISIPCSIVIRESI